MTAGTRGEHPVGQLGFVGCERLLLRECVRNNAPKSLHT